MASLDLAIKSASVIFFIGADVYYLEAVIVGNKSVGIYHVSFINSGNGYIGRGISGSALHCRNTCCNQSIIAAVYHLDIRETDSDQLPKYTSIVTPAILRGGE